MTENPRYLAEQLITCIGNKRALLPFIGTAVELVRERAGRDKLSFFDVFSGSGIVARFFRQYASLILANDLEPYSSVINRCYLSDKATLDDPEFDEVYRGIVARLEEEPPEAGLIAELYAPRDDGAIRKGERAFYTVRNARYLDAARRLIGEAPGRWRDYLLAPLLAEASVHANTAGVFKGFYKNRHTGIGQFGGKKGDALSRITGPISLPRPVLSEFSGPSIVYSGDANEVCANAPEVDVAYLDPPYNQHPYGSNYFMLNLLIDYERPAKISPVSGIPADWQRSSYNRRREAAGSLYRLADSLRARFLLVSFNSEGFIGKDEMETLLGKVGKVETLETKYNTFRGSRNLANRPIHVSEYLYLVDKG